MKKKISNKIQKENQYEELKGDVVIEKAEKEVEKTAEGRIKQTNKEK